MRAVGDGGDWTPPPGVERRQVDGYGNIVASNCPIFGDVREEWFLEGNTPIGRCQYPTTAGWDTLYGYDPSDTLGMQPGDEGWLQRMRRRLFGEDKDTARAIDDDPARIRPGRAEDTVPMFERPGVPDPDRREPEQRREPPGQQRQPPAADAPPDERPRPDDDDEGKTPIGEPPPDRSD
jgi:hypothetical protein